MHLSRGTGCPLLLLLPLGHRGLLVCLLLVSQTSAQGQASPHLFLCGLHLGLPSFLPLLLLRPQALLEGLDFRLAIDFARWHDRSRMERRQPRYHAALWQALYVIMHPALILAGTINLDKSSHDFFHSHCHSPTP